MPFLIVRGDITRMDVDAIVNAANSSLLGGGGVDGAIHRAAGPELKEECRTLGGCAAGDAKITKGYRLKAKYVIHTVGPLWRGGGFGERETLLSCYRQSLALALKQGCASVAFPLISAGAYGCPAELSLKAAEEAAAAFLGEHDMEVYLTLIGNTGFVGNEAIPAEVSRALEELRLFGAREVCRGADEIARPIPPKESSVPGRGRNGASWFRGGKSVPGASGEDDAGGLYAPMPLYDAGAPGMDDAMTMPEYVQGSGEPDWDTLLRDADEGFSQALLRLIDEKGMTDAQCYKRANVDRKLFHKIRANPSYRPGKPTVFAFAVALELSLDETRSLLDRAGFSLSHARGFDIILEYFISNRIYDIYRINEVLFRYDMPLLGSGM